MVLPRLAWLFPGQGTQAVGMGKALYACSPAARALMDTADAVLGGGVLDRCFTGPAAELRLTLHAQPAIVVVSLAALAACVEAAAGGRDRRPGGPVWRPSPPGVGAGLRCRA